MGLVLLRVKHLIYPEPPTVLNLLTKQYYVCIALRPLSELHVSEQAQDTMRRHVART